MYCTTQDVRYALAPGEAGDPPTYVANQTATDLTDPQIEDAIAEADSRIDAFVPPGYKVPTYTIQATWTGTAYPGLIYPGMYTTSSPEGSAVPVDVAHPLFRFISRDIAAYLATLTWKKNKDVPEEDPVRLRYGMATDLLALIRTGDVNLPDNPDNPYTDGEVTIFNQYEGSLFGLEDFALGVLPRGVNLYYLRSHGMV